MATQAAEQVRIHREKKTLVRRAAPDRSQQIRHLVQGIFVALNAWIGVQFYLWVRYFERGGSGFYVARPAGVEGWLPIAGLMNFKYFLATGHIPAVHAAAMFLFAAFVLMSLLLKKAFCSWLCPVGTFSEFLGSSAAGSSAATCACRAGLTCRCAVSSTCCSRSFSSSSAPCPLTPCKASCSRLTVSLPT